MGQLMVGKAAWTGLAWLGLGLGLDWLGFGHNVWASQHG